MLPPTVLEQNYSLHDRTTSQLVLFGVYANEMQLAAATAAPVAAATSSSEAEIGESFLLFFVFCPRSRWLQEPMVPVHGASRTPAVMPLWDADVSESI